MGILCINETSNFVNLPQNALESSTENSRTVN